MTVKALLIDLDDTLYPEESYVESGFRALAADLADRFGVDPRALTAFLLRRLARDGRGRIFDALLAAPNFALKGVTVSELVDLYRQHEPDLTFYPGVGEILQALRARYRLALVTDGLPAMQRRKSAALGLAARFDCVVYCWEHDAPKPDETGYRLAMAELGCAAGETVIVGDDPLNGLRPAQSLGCRAIRIRAGRFAHLPSPDDAWLIGEIDRFTEIATALP